VSFEVHRGEIYGLLGKNGAGKSTILTMVSGVQRPTSGTIRVQGKISPLLELGVGFAPELSGRENALLNGILLGLRRREMEGRLPQILEFAGLTDFADQPLKTYSSGMQARLGFAVAVSTDPDVLLVDEALAVGDAEFTERCLTRIAEIRAQGATILFVSHDLEMVAKICDRAGWLSNGRLMGEGEAPEITEEYSRSTGALAQESTALTELAREHRRRSQP
jgi:lipopolysaccharide transport system ATP-binding protein